MRRLVRPFFLLVGLGFVVAAAWRAVATGELARLPGPATTGAAVGVLGAGLLMGSSAWLALFPEISDRHDFRFGFFVAQLGKYVPGGVWQAAGQIGFAQRDDVGLGQRSVRFVTSAVIMVAAGGAVGSIVTVTCSQCAGWLRLAAMGGLAPMALLYGPVMGTVVERLDRSGRATADLVSPPARRWRCLGWSITSVLLNAVAYFLLADAISGGTPLAGTIAAFALAWTAGYIALPFPSGIGVREAVLVALAPAGIGAGAVVTASLAHRLVSLAAEVLLVGATAIPARLIRRRTAPSR